MSSHVLSLLTLFSLAYSPQDLSGQLFNVDPDLLLLERKTPSHRIMAHPAIGSFSQIF